MLAKTMDIGQICTWDSQKIVTNYVNLVIIKYTTYKTLYLLPWG